MRRKGIWLWCEGKVWRRKASHSSTSILEENLEFGKAKREIINLVNQNCRGKVQRYISKLSRRRKCNGNTEMKWMNVVVSPEQTVLRLHSFLTANTIRQISAAVVDSNVIATSHFWVHIAFDAASFMSRPLAFNKATNPNMKEVKPSCMEPKSIML